MRLKQIFVLSLMVFITELASADQCLSPYAILIHEGKPGQYIIDLPKNSGFTLAGESITGIGSIIFSAAGIEDHKEAKSKYGPYFNIFAYREIMCWYEVLPANGVFILTKNNSQNQSYDLSERWYWFRGFGYFCDETNESACSFVLSKS